MAYNVKNYLRMPRRVDGEAHEHAPKPEAEVAAVVKLVQQTAPDILGLVEMGTAEDVADLQKRLEKVGLRLPHASHVDAFDADRRVALLSRFPIVATDHQTQLTFAVGPRRLPFRRGILDATVRLHETYDLRVLGVHLKSKREVSEADEALIRRNEAHLTRRHVTSILRENPETNLLLFGDFNDSPQSPTIKAIQGQYGSPGHLMDLSLADDRGHRWTYFWSQTDQYSRFDFLFVNRGLRPEIQREKSYIVADPDWLQASDHRPVVTTLQLSKNQ